MRRWVWAALGMVSLASACDKTDAPAAPLDPAATATASSASTPTSTSTSTATATATATPTPTPTPTSDAGHEAARATDAGDGGPTPAEAPLLYWMKRNAAPAMLQGDIFALATAFDTIASFSPRVPPPAYANWVSIAQDGAAAARAASLEGAKGACRGCHTQYRNTYKAEMRARPLP